MNAECSDASFYEGKAHGPIDLSDMVIAIHLDGRPCEFSDVSLQLDEYLDLQLKWMGSLTPGIDKINQEPLSLSKVAQQLSSL